VDPGRVHVIPHGLLRPAATPDATLPPELPAFAGPVVLCFGLLRPYKGLDVLVEAWRGVEGAELWIVGAPRMDTAPLHAAAPPGVRFVERFVSEGEAAALFRRADLAVLPYREIDQSGVLFTALSFGVPLVLTDVGGFPEIAGAGAAALVPANDPRALHAALTSLLADPARRTALAAAATKLAEERHHWATIARAHLELYASLLA
jgi:glycosyltransferase involved in cell wall biosynthesis